MGNIEITPSTKVSELLDAYPDLEEALIGIAPPFKKLKNPFLRKSVAKVATIKHISAVGDIPLNELINKLRVAVGQQASDDYIEIVDEDYFSKQPDWFSADRVSLSVNEESLKDKDKMTLVTILQQAKNVKKGEIIELVTTFLPAPSIDTLRSKGYSSWTRKAEDGLIKSYFLKNTD